MFSLFVFLMTRFDNDVKREMRDFKLAWIVPILVDVMIVIGLFEVWFPTCKSIGGVLSGAR